jgi:hypothetical protein
MRKPMAVKIIGEQGEEWDELARNEINPEWDIRVEGGNEDAYQDEIKKKSLKEMLETLAPDELAVTSPKWRVKTKLQAIGVDDDDIRSAFDLEGEYNKEILSEASKMIQDVLQNKPVKPFRGATTAFVQKIIDYAVDNDLEMAEFEALMQLAEMHMPMAEENMARKAIQMQASRGMLQPPMSATEQLYGQEPAANTPGGTQSMSQGMTNLAPKPPMV